MTPKVQQDFPETNNPKISTVVHKQPHTHTRYRGKIVHHILKHRPSGAQNPHMQPEK